MTKSSAVFWNFPPIPPTVLREFYKTHSVPAHVPNSGPRNLTLIESPMHLSMSCYSFSVISGFLLQSLVQPLHASGGDPSVAGEEKKTDTWADVVSGRQ